MKEDSREETLAHREAVGDLLRLVAKELLHRAVYHDQSKLGSPELEIFNEYTWKLRETTYGSEEYKKYLKEMHKALEHHYASNRHHPEHFENGIQGMNLVDMVEMFCDWSAATQRHADGDIHNSINQNKDRFGYSEDLAEVFRNTAECYSNGKVKEQNETEK